MSKKKTHRKIQAQTGTSAPAGIRGDQSANKGRSQAKRSASKRHQNQTSMIWMWIAIGAAAIVVIIAIGFYQNSVSTPTIESVQLPPEQAYQKYQAGAYILDVRSESEWEQIHIPHSNLIPLDELPARLDELPQDRDILVVCLAGKRSQEGQQILAQAGFMRTFCLKDGIQAWQAAGFPIESSG